MLTLKEKSPSELRNPSATSTEFQIAVAIAINKGHLSSAAEMLMQQKQMFVYSRGGDGDGLGSGGLERQCNPVLNKSQLQGWCTKEHTNVEMGSWY